MEDIQSSEQELSTEVSSSDPVESQGSSQQVFEVDGQKYTSDQIKQMRAAQMRHDDYTKKTQSFAQERQQWSKSSKSLQDGGLETDLERVRNGQASVSDFKRVYHKDFHHYVDQLMKTQGNKPNQSGFDPAFMNDVNQIKQQFHQMQVDAIDKELDVKEQEFTKKFPYADPASVYMVAESLLDAKQRDGLKVEISSKEWDNIWKMVHDKQSDRFKQYQSSLVQGQKSQNAKSRDVGAGGGIPGQAPKVGRNIKEASDYARQHQDEF